MQHAKLKIFILCAIAASMLFSVSAFAWPWESWGLSYAPSPPAAYEEYIPVPAWRSNMLGRRPLTRRQEGLDIRGLRPIICNSFNSAQSINTYIGDDIIPSLIMEARRLRARAISFRYEYRPTNDIVSIVIFADVATALPHTLVRSVSFCTFHGDILSMNQAAGMEITSLLERVLAEKIRSNPERYYAALAAPIAEQAFYLTQDRLVVLFDGFRLSTRIGEVETIELNLQNILTVVLETEDYREDGPYGLKMIPLREMLVYQLGYQLQWDEFDRRATVRRNDRNIIELRDGDNEYIILGTQRRSLEVAPQMLGDGVYHNMYVPITFFDQILPLTVYTIEPDGRITFLAYFAD